MPSVFRFGSEFRINADLSGGQSAPSGATLTNGNYVVAWTDGDLTIEARIFGPDGIPVGGDIDVSTSGGAHRASVAALAGGGFVVGWSDDTPDFASDVRGQVFTNAGTPVGGEILFNTTTAGTQIDVDIAPLANGGFVAIWASNPPSGDQGIIARLFDASGSPVGTEFRVNPPGVVGESGSVAALTGGGFVVVWGNLGSHSVFAQRFDSAGQPVGSIMPIDVDVGSTTLANPVVAALPNDGFVVTWKDASAGSKTIEGQVFDGGGSPVSDVFTVNDTPTGFDPQGLTVQGFPDGRFLIVWPDFSGTIGDSDEGAIVGQMYDPSGTRIDRPFPINGQTLNGQFDGTITALSDGKFLVGWTDQGATGTPGGVDAKAQIFELAPPPLFDGTANNVDFNTIDTNDFSAPFHTGAGGDDVVILPNNAGTVAALMAGGFSGGAGSDTITEGTASVPLLGGDGDDILIGNSGQDVLAGEAGDDTLTGNGGGDQFIGGTGDDIFIITSASDSIVENVGEGIDTTRTSLSVYALRNNVENLVYTGTASFTGVGNALNNVITSGTTVASNLLGRGGNDTYIVSIAGDTIVEDVGGGSDTVQTALTAYALRDNVENLTFIGTASFTGVGTAADNVIAGGTGAASNLLGRGGNDTYVVSVVGDTIVEDVGGGTDEVETALAVYFLRAANVENLTFTGTGNFMGAGNALDNVLTGGGGADYLYAGDGVDTLVGGGGADVFLFSAAVAGVDSILDFTSGSDRIFLNDAVFTHTPTFNLVQGSGALTAPDADTTIFYHSDTGQLGYDADGNGAGGEVIFATLSTGLTLTPSDFVFY